MDLLRRSLSEGARTQRGLQDRCLNVELGLVGMHIVTRVQSGNGDEWIWSTLEHRANAPKAGNAQAINSLYAKELFPGGCTGPDQGAQFAFFYAGCPERPTNERSGMN